jgi:peptide/nickel transport system substrate-binding protein
VRLRRAFALALDVPELVATVTAGTSRANRSVIPISSAFHSEAQSVVPPRDLETARRLMREAGYTGQTIRMITTRRYAPFYDAALVAQAMAQDAGFNVEIEVLDWATELDRYTRGDYQMMSFGYSARLEPSLSYEMVTGLKDEQPRKVWDNAEVHRILAESMRITDLERRQVLFDDLFRRLLDDVPLIAIYQSSDEMAVRANVHGFRGWAVGQPRLWGVRID